MQNAKNLLWLLKGELTELEKEPTFPNGSHLKPSPQHLPPAHLPLHLRTETICRASSGCPAFSMLCLGAFPAFGNSAESPVAQLCWRRGRGHAHCGLKSEIWQLGQGHSHRFCTASKFSFVKRCFPGLWINSGSPSRAIRGGLSLFCGFAWWGGVDGLGLTLR